MVIIILWVYLANSMERVPATGMSHYSNYLLFLVICESAGE